VTRDDIIRLAREAGWNGIYSKPLMSIRMQEENFLRFAALVAAAERKACKSVAELAAREIDDTNGTATYIAKAIGARGAYD
jgi:hypothetical protein